LFSFDLHDFLPTSWSVLHGHSLSILVATMLAKLVVAVAALLFSLASPVMSDVPADLISQIPGYGPTKTKQYSGYLPVDAEGSVMLHYWLVTSPNAKSDPLTIVSTLSSCRVLSLSLGKLFIVVLCRNISVSASHSVARMLFSPCRVVLSFFCIFLSVDERSVSSFSCILHLLVWFVVSLSLSFFG